MSNNEQQPKSISTQMREAEELGAKVAKIMNEAKKKADKILKEYGHAVNINVDFYKKE